jgi:hypothetical protein
MALSSRWRCRTRVLADDPVGRNPIDIARQRRARSARHSERHAQSADVADMHRID